MAQCVMADLMNILKQFNPNKTVKMKQLACNILSK